MPQLGSRLQVIRSTKRTAFDRERSFYEAVLGQASAHEARVGPCVQRAAGRDCHSDELSLNRSGGGRRGGARSFRRGDGRRIGGDGE